MPKGVELLALSLHQCAGIRKKCIFWPKGMELTRWCDSFFNYQEKHMRNI
jgi:hypothetical protein